MSRLPSLRPRQVVAALKRIGFVEVRQKGSHLYLWNASTRRMTTVPMHAKDIKPGTLRAILRQIGMTETEFQTFL